MERIRILIVYFERLCICEIITETRCEISRLMFSHKSLSVRDLKEKGYRRFFQVYESEISNQILRIDMLI